MKRSPTAKGGKRRPPRRSPAPSAACRKRNLAAFDSQGKYDFLQGLPGSDPLVRTAIDRLEFLYRGAIPTKPLPSLALILEPLSPLEIITGRLRETGVVGATVPTAAATPNSAAVDAVLAQALSLWKTALGKASLPQVSIVFAALPSGELAETRIDALNARGAPIAGTITIDPTAAGVGWFVDATPASNSEFDTAYPATAMHAGGNSLAAGKYDLLTVLAHEIGHLLGFDSSAPAYAAHVGSLWRVRNCSSHRGSRPSWRALQTPTTLTRRSIPTI